MTSPLALLGGAPAVIEPGPHFSWPLLDGRTDKAVLDQLHRSISVYDRSDVVAELENALQEYFGVRHAVLTSSGTAALHSTYAACGIGPGDEVIVPAYTFLATVTPLLHLGAVPVLADCDATGNLSLSDVAARITPDTVAIMVTHLWGIPADLAALRQLADARGLLLLEDGSHAHGAAVAGRKVGSVGDLAAFSMNGPKPLSAGEGGFVLTNDDEAYYRLLLHGHYNKRCRSEIPGEHPLHRYAVTGMGLKFRIHPLAAAIALDQLERLDSYLIGRVNMADYLCFELGQLPGITVPELALGTRAAWYGLPLTYVPAELDDLPVERFYDALRAEGLDELDRPGSTCPLNLLPLFQDLGPLFPHHPHRDRIAYRPGQFPVAEQLHRTTLKLPVWHREEDVPLARQYVAGFRKVVAHHHDLKDNS
ncbi:DegT/DnrJ/EryC1/StrS family aminotransferase [Amycolatopsis sp. H20-H5]|uniref:DegT/DnrJ/EryC1/StrS family aminotransferase n=1 Tax=Amycolatopsis sp. H20-H5 TaxID=3046309 RepID=UPI002DBE96D1|nr:DegT/DnrJ/EryC1/StrS family aminotransferase [Amycolatopsis sp. H20-H5]MEC3978155.1 DegT/DnrJ/EryC1/StrS family aminotransferase [Amycolatopsis sp. H20-H5]